MIYFTFHSPGLSNVQKAVYWLKRVSLALFVVGLLGQILRKCLERMQENAEAPPVSKEEEVYFYVKVFTSLGQS